MAMAMMAETHSRQSRQGKPEAHGRRGNPEAHGRQGKPEKTHDRQGKLLNVLGVTLLVAVILVCFPLTVPRFLGYEVYHVISGSMEPAIPTGSLVYVKEAAPEEIKEDEIIAFYSSSETDSIVTHRVVENHTVSGEFITKGDANDAEDPMPVSYDSLLGKVTLSIPYLGRLLAAVAGTGGKIAVGCVIAAAVVMIFVGGRL